MKFVPPDLRAGEHVFYWQEDPSKLKVEIIAVATVFQANISKLVRPLDTVDLEELQDSR